MLRHEVARLRAQGGETHLIPFAQTPFTLYTPSTTA